MIEAAVPRAAGGGAAAALLPGVFS